MTKEEITKAVDNLKKIRKQFNKYEFTHSIDLAIDVLEEQERPTGEHKCMTCKYCDGEIINKHCRKCSRSWADLYEEAEND